MEVLALSKHALKGVQNLTLILTLWSIELHISHMWEGITYSIPRSRRPFLPSYQLISFLLQGAKADLSSSSKCSASSSEKSSLLALRGGMGIC